MPSKCYDFFCGLWCLLVLFIVGWGGLALVTLATTPLAETELFQQYLIAFIAAVIVLGLLLYFTLLRQRFPSVIGIIQFVASWTIFPVFKLIHEAYPLSLDHTLYRIDKVLWGGKSLTDRVMLLETKWLTEVLSFCYFSFYFIILVSVIYFVIKAKTAEAKAFFYGLMLMYLFGFVGYMLVPAAGPYVAFPSQFPYPVTAGMMAELLVKVVDKGVTGMDVFPSLHCGISLYIFGFYGLRGYRKAVFIVAPLFIGISVATLYLRYHYGIDLIVGALLAIGVLIIVNNYQKELSHV